jgi:hypothetical protein
LLGGITMSCKRTLLVRLKIVARFGIGSPRRGLNFQMH